MKGPVGHGRPQKGGAKREAKQGRQEGSDESIELYKPTKQAWEVCVSVARARGLSLSLWLRLWVESFALG